MKTSKLEKFLINRNLLEKFENNMNGYHSYHFTMNELIENEPIDNQIMGSFKWARTPEGKEFWRGVHHKWMECLDNETL